MTTGGIYIDDAGTPYAPSIYKHSLKVSNQTSRTQTFQSLKENLFRVFNSKSILLEKQCAIFSSNSLI